MENVFDVKPIVLSGKDFIVYLVYNKRLVEQKNSYVDPFLLYNLKPEDYLVRVAISKSTAKVTSIQTGSNGGKGTYSLSDVAKIINASSYIATDSIAREDHIMYLSTIFLVEHPEQLSIDLKADCKIGQAGNFFAKKGSKIDIRFPYYKAVVGPASPSKTARAVIDEYFKGNSGDSNVLIIPYGVNDSTEAGHMVLLIVKRNDGCGKKYQIKCFDSSLTFFKGKVGGSRGSNSGTKIAGSSYFGELENCATISKFFNSDIQDTDGLCSHYCEAFIEYVIKERSLPTSEEQVKNQLTSDCRLITANYGNKLGSMLRDLKQNGCYISTEKTNYEGPSYRLEIAAKGGSLKGGLFEIFGQSRQVQMPATTNASQESQQLQSPPDHHDQKLEPVSNPETELQSEQQKQKGVSDPTKSQLLVGLANIKTGDDMTSEVIISKVEQEPEMVKNSSCP